MCNCNAFKFIEKDCYTTSRVCSACGKREYGTDVPIYGFIPHVPIPIEHGEMHPRQKHMTYAQSRERKRKIKKMYAQGLKAAEIAARTGLPVKTVRRYKYEAVAA